TFVGRDRELAEIEALLTGTTDVQLRVALDGLPGIGKTELARQVVARLARGKKFPGGIFWFHAEHADLPMQWAKLAEDAGGPALPPPRGARGVAGVADGASREEGRCDLVGAGHRRARGPAAAPAARRIGDPTPGDAPGPLAPHLVPVVRGPAAGAGACAPAL